MILAAALQGPLGSQIPPEAIHAVILLGEYFLSGCVILAVVPPVLRVLTRRWTQPLPPVIEATTPPETAAQLARIEQAVEAMAIEVERIAEAQRFSAKLLAERPNAPGALPRDGR